MIQVNGVLVDLRTALISPIYSSEKPKETVSKAIADESKALQLIAKLSAFLGDKEFLLGYLTYADLHQAYIIMFCRSVVLSLELEDPFANYPNLLQHAKRVYEHDALKGYAESDSYFLSMNNRKSTWFKEHPLPEVPAVEVQSLNK